MVLEKGGFLQYGSTLSKEICLQLINEEEKSVEYIFGLMQLRDLLNGRGWLCKIRNQEFIEILEAKNIDLDQNRWSSNHQRKYKKRDEALSNIHFDQVDKEDIEKIMHERNKLRQVLSNMKSKRCCPS